MVNGIFWVGIFLLCCSLLFSPWLLEIFYSWTIHPKQIDLVNKIFIIVFQAYLLSISLTILLKNEFIKKAAKIACLILTSMLVALIPIEIYLNYEDARVIKVMPSREFHHYYPPGTTGYEFPSAADEKKIHININEWGMRGDLPTTPKLPNERRLLILGDSFIHAGKLEYSHTMGPILKKLINIPHINVLTHGIPSWSPLLELNWLAKNFDRIKPDIVMLVLCENDFYNSESKYADSYYKTHAVFNAKGLPVSFNLNPSSYQKSLFYKMTFPKIRNLVIKTVEDIERAQKPRRLLEQSEIDKLLTVPENELEIQLDKYIKKDYIGNITRENIRLGRPWQLWSPDTRKNVELGFMYIKLLNAQLKNHSVDLIVTLAPFGWNVAADESVQGKMAYGLGKETILSMAGLEEKIRGFCNDNNILLFYLPDILRKFRKKNRNQIYFSMNGHWNAEGHDLIAHEIYKFLNLKKPKELAFK